MIRIFKKNGDLYLKQTTVQGKEETLIIVDSNFFEIAFEGLYLDKFSDINNYFRCKLPDAIDSDVETKLNNLQSHIHFKIEAMFKYEEHLKLIDDHNNSMMYLIRMGSLTGIRNHLFPPWFPDNREKYIHNYIEAEMLKKHPS